MAEKFDEERSLVAEHVVSLRRANWSMASWGTSVCVLTRNAF